MGETAEFEKLNTLEARLAAALDRIAAGLGSAMPAVALEDPGLSSASLEDAMIRAETAEARVAALEAQMTGLLDAAKAAAQALTARDAEIAQLQASLAAQTPAAAAVDDDDAKAQAAAEAAAQLAAQTARIADLETRLARLRSERDAALAAQEEARDIAEELQAAAGHHPDDRAMALRAEIKELQVINDRLIKNINRLRGENASDPSVLNKTLVVELDALRAQRASEAAELERILADLDQAATGDGAHA
jgi:DNA repair exonuclease SbcCD ATPase subunit